MLPKSRWNRFKTWLFDLKASDAMMVVLTLVIAATGVVGIRLVIQGGEDTKRIVKASEDQAGAARQIAAASLRNATAAERFSTAAERNAAAAASFSNSAVHINNGVKDAVGALKSQVEELKAQVETSRQQFAASERPYVNVVHYEYPKRNDPEDHRVHIDLLIINYGRSPALHVIHVGRIFYGQNAMTQADTFFSELGLTHGGHRTWEGGSSLILPPFSPSDIENLPRTTLVTQEPLGPEDTALMHTRLGQIVAVDHMEYKDLAGNTYQTDFCAESLPSGAISNCPTHNEMR
jgi:hypothetical protein